MTDISPSPPTLTADHASDLMIHRGGAMRAAPDEIGVIEGYLITFTGPEQKDLYKTYFDRNTNYHRTAESMVGMACLYNHGLDSTWGVDPIGYVTRAKFDDKGLQIAVRLSPDVAAWKEDQRRQRAEYLEAIYELAKSGELGWSSGALPQSVRVADDGHIMDWLIVEPSATPTEAAPFTNVISARAYLERLTGRSDDSEAIRAADGLLDPATPVTPSSTDHPVSVSPTEQETAVMDAVAELKQMIADLMTFLMQKGEVSEAEAPVAMSAMEEEMKTLSEDDQKAVADPATPEDDKNMIAQKFFAAALGAVTKQRAARHARLGSAFDATKRSMMDAPVTNRLPAYSPPRIESMTDRRYDAWNAKDMLTYAMVRHASLHPDHRRNATLDNLGFDEGFVRALKFKVGETYLKREHSKDANEIAFVRGIVPFRANEIDSTTNTGFGLEWVAQLWSSDIWEKSRNEPGVLERLLSKGAHEYTLARGAGTFNVPTESTDPTVYTLSQSNDIGSDQRPPVRGTVSPFGTGVIQSTPKGMIAIASFTNFLDEDSAIAVIPQLTRQLETKIKESIDQAIINGDTATANATNINLIDGTPGSGIAAPYYLNNNGLLKYPLVTNTAMSRDAGGAFNVDTFLETWKLFNSEFGSRTQNLLWLMDHFTFIAALRLPELLTDDVRKDAATLTSGELRPVFGIEAYRTGFMAKANSAGKVPAAGGTLGRLALVYAPYWAIVRKRDITLEEEYRPTEQARTMVATVRFDFVNRGAQASAISFNVGL